MIRVGECNQCGKCCDPPTPERIEAYRGWDYMVQHPEGCPFGMRVNGKIGCGNYDNRPQMCKDFPQHPLDIVVLPECGYSFKDK